MTSAEQEPPRFWCHECGASVETRVDEPSEEVCCVQCGGNFVEEIEEVRSCIFLRLSMHSVCRNHFFLFILSRV